MTDTRSDIKRLEKEIDRTVAAYERLVALSEERENLIYRGAGRVKTKTKSAIKPDVWTIGFIILIIVEFVWLLGMIWGVM